MYNLFLPTAPKMISKSAFVSRNIGYNFTAPNSCSIFTAEAVAHFHAVKYLKPDPDDKFIIFTGLPSVMQAIK